MLRFLSLALLCLRQLAAAEQQSHTGELVIPIQLTSERQQKRRAADEVSYRGPFSAVSEQYGTEAAVAEGTPNESSPQTAMVYRSLREEPTPGANALPVWCRNLAEADVLSPAPISEDSYRDRTSNRAEDNGKPAADKSEGAEATIKLQRAPAIYTEERQGSEAQGEASALQDAPEHRKTQAGIEEPVKRAGAENVILLNDGRGGMLGDNYNSLDGARPQLKPRMCRQQDPVVEMDDTPATTDDMDAREEVSASSGGTNPLATAAAGLRSLVPLVDMQAEFEAEGLREDQQEAGRRFTSSSGLRDLRKRRSYAAALPLTLPLHPRTAPQPLPKLPPVPAPPAPIKTQKPKQLMPPHAKMPTVKNIFPPPQKVHKVQKIYPPLKMVRKQKVAPPPKKIPAPKTVAYPVKELSKKVQTRYFFAHKKYIPPDNYVPAPKKFAPVPIYVPAPQKW